MTIVFLLSSTGRVGTVVCLQWKALKGLKSWIDWPFHICGQYISNKNKTFFETVRTTDNYCIFFWACTTGNVLQLACDIKLHYGSYADYFLSIGHLRNSRMIDTTRIRSNSFLWSPVKILPDNRSSVSTATVLQSQLRYFIYDNIPPGNILRI